MADPNSCHCNERGLSKWSCAQKQLRGRAHLLLRPHDDDVHEPIPHCTPATTRVSRVQRCAQRPTARAGESLRGPVNDVNSGQNTRTRKKGGLFARRYDSLRLTRSSGALQMRMRVSEWWSSGHGRKSGALDLGLGMRMGEGKGNGARITIRGI